MKNSSIAVTNVSTPLPCSGTFIHITNLSSTPVALRLGESGPAIYGEGVILPYQYSSFTFDSNELTLALCSAITQSGTAQLSLCYS